MPPAPVDLSDESRSLWNALVNDLRLVHGVDEPGSADLVLLADVLRACDRRDEISLTLAREGLTVAGSRGQTRPHPLVVIEKELRAEIARSFERLRLTPRWRATAIQIQRLNALTKGV
jgi:P27 family predicted phage terminase small subunit